MYERLKPFLDLEIKLDGTSLIIPLKFIKLL